LLAAAFSMLGCAAETEAPDRHQEIWVNVGAQMDVTLQTFGKGYFHNPTMTGASVRFVEARTVERQGTETTRQVFRFEAMTDGRAEAQVLHTENRGMVIPFVVVR
jgi:hypothetical protein